MKQFERDLVKALSLVPTVGLVKHAAAILRSQPQYLQARWDGLLPAQDTEAQRESMKHIVWPAPRVRHIVEGIKTKTLGEYLDHVDATFARGIFQAVFALWMSAFDAVLERAGAVGTLGGELKWLVARHTIDPQLMADLCEIIARRNDVAHGNAMVRDEYLRPSGLYEPLLKSSWYVGRAWPSVGMDHEFSIEYLYWALDKVWAAARLEFS